MPQPTRMLETTVNRYYISECKTLVMKRLPEPAWGWVLLASTGDKIDEDQYRDELAKRHRLELVDLPYHGPVQEA